MATYKFPGLGLISVLRNGEYGGSDRYKWNVRGNDVNGVPFRTWITTPNGWDENSVVACALDAISYEVAEFTGDDTGNMWGIYSEDMENGDEYAASYRVDGTSHYRMYPFTLNPDGETLRTISDVENHLREELRIGVSGPGSVVDVYVNNNDEPSFRYIVGPRGGLRRENY
jgi:hypothetical protein